jgi:hypothetical protein
MSARCKLQAAILQSGPCLPLCLFFSPAKDVDIRHFILRSETMRIILINRANDGVIVRS